MRPWAFVIGIGLDQQIKRRAHLEITNFDIQSSYTKENQPYQNLRFKGI